MRVPCFRNTCKQADVDHITAHPALTRQNVNMETSCWTHPAWLNDFVVAVEAVLDVHQLLKVVLKTQRQR